MQNYFLFDCETGGIGEKYSLLTLYGVILNHKLDVVDNIDLAIKPLGDLYRLSPEAMKKNGIDIIQHHKSATIETEASEIFYDFCCKHSLSGKLTPAGHCVSGDIQYAKRLLQNGSRTEKDWYTYFSHRYLDTASIAHFLKLTGKLPSNINCSLASLAKYFDMSYEGAHEAKFDVNLTLGVLRKMLLLII